MIERFWSIKTKVITFLVNLDSEETKYHKFLNDILEYFNTLNTELQGNKKLICNLISSVSAFHRKFDIFEQDIKIKNLFIF